MNRNEHIHQAEVLLREVAQDSPTAHTQVDRQKIRDSILTAQVHATLALALSQSTSWTPVQY